MDQYLTDLEKRAAFFDCLAQAQKVMGLNDVEFAAQLMEVAMELGPELFDSNDDGDDKEEALIEGLH